MNIRGLTAGVLLAAGAVGGAVAVSGGVAAAHDATTNVRCTADNLPKGSFEAIAYFEGGTYTVYVDGSQVDSGAVNDGTVTKGYLLGAADVAHTFRVTIDAPGDEYDRDVTLTSLVCQTPPTTTTPPVTTTEPPVTTTEPPVTTSTTEPPTTSTLPPVTEPPTTLPSVPDIKLVTDCGRIVVYNDATDELRYGKIMFPDVDETTVQGNLPLGATFSEDEHGGSVRYVVMVGGFRADGFIDTDCETPVDTSIGTPPTVAPPSTIPSSPMPGGTLVPPSLPTTVPPTAPQLGELPQTGAAGAAWSALIASCLLAAGCGAVMVARRRKASAS